MLYHSKLIKLCTYFNSVLVWSSLLYLRTSRHIPVGSGCLKQLFTGKQHWGNYILVRTAASTSADGRYFHKVTLLLLTSRLSRNFQIFTAWIQGNFHFMIILKGNNIWKSNTWSVSGEITVSFINCKISQLTFRQAMYVLKHNFHDFKNDNLLSVK
jgi:hypothetical protein